MFAPAGDWPPAPVEPVPEPGPLAASSGTPGGLVSPAGGDASAPGLPLPASGGGPGADASAAGQRGGAEPKPEGTAVPPRRRPGPPDHQPAPGGWFDRLASVPPDRGPSCGLDILSPRPGLAGELAAAPPSSGRGSLITGTSGLVLSPDGPPAIPWRRLPPGAGPLAGSRGRAAAPGGPATGDPRTVTPDSTADVPVVREFLLLPRGKRARVLVPAGRQVAAAAIRGYGRPAMPGAALAARVLPALLSAGIGRAGLGRRMVAGIPPGTVTIESYLGGVLGQDLQVSLLLGAPRANRKPVLQLLTGDGVTAGFAKLGDGPLARELIAAEHAALRRLGRAGLTGLQLPQVLHYGKWAGRPVLVLSALPAGPRRRRWPAGQLTAAMAELAVVTGLRYGPLAGSGYLGRLTAGLATAGPGPDRVAVSAALAVITRRAGTAALAFGCWHGDWTPWNMSGTPAGLAVWDWERFATGVPAGFDALHFRLHAEVLGGRHPARPDAARAACAALVRDAPRVLDPYGTPPAAARLTAVLYLAEITARYLADGQDQTGHPLGSPGRWLIPALGETAGWL